MTATVLRSIELAGLSILESVYPAGMRMARHAHEYASITAVVRGAIAETTDAGEHAGRSFSVLVKPAGTLHSDRALGRMHVRTVSLQVPARSRLASEMSGLRWAWLEGCETAAAGLNLFRAVHEAPLPQIEAAANALIATVIPAAGSSPARRPSWVGSVLARIECAFDEPLRFEDIARDLGLHPVYVSRAFHHHVGQSMGDYVRALRLSQARHLLSSTDRSIAAISADSGFSDPSHLCRSFARTHGVTPKVFRRLLAAV